MNRLEGFPKVYCMSLADAAERHASLKQQCEKYGLSYELILHSKDRGFDGRHTDLKKDPRIVVSYPDSLKSQEIACSVGHLEMIKHWLDTSDTETAIFVEDDINLENCEYWNFNWKEVVDLLPPDWKCIQLALITCEQIKDVVLRRRVTADWCATAYLMNRSYAKWLIEQCYKDGVYQLSVPGDYRAMPIVENMIFFPAEPKVYAFPVFTEKNTFGTTFDSSAVTVKEHNANSEKAVSQWWRTRGKTCDLKKLMSNPERLPAIPMIGTATVNGGKWLKRLVESVDYPVDDFFIINNNGRGEIDEELDNLAKNHGNANIGKVRVLHMPSNLGVAASWNLMIKSYLKCPYWIIVNDDVAFGPGFLGEMYFETIRDPGAGMIHGYEGEHGIGSWDLFLIRDHVIQEYGLFDENLYPAYNEDADYFLRFIHKPIRRVMNLNSEYYHGDGKKNEYHTHGSQTRRKDQQLSENLGRVNEMNIEYMTQKWGPGWRLCGPTMTPFSDRGGPFPLSTTSFDLRFLRRKHLGF